MELKEKKILRVVEGNPSGKKILLNTPANFFSLFGLQVVETLLTVVIPKIIFNIPNEKLSRPKASKTFLATCSKPHS